MTMHERIMEGKLFTDMCEGMPQERLEAKRRMKRFNELDPGDIEGRVAMLAEIFGKPCDGWVEPPFYFCYGRHISLGKGAYINVNCSFIDDGKIIIGDGVMFGPAVTIATVGHPINPAMRGYMYCDHVTIGNNCGSVPIPSSAPALPSEKTPSLVQAAWSPRTFLQTAWPQAIPAGSFGKSTSTICSITIKIDSSILPIWKKSGF